jgi:hypothetical protein
VRSTSSHFTFIHHLNLSGSVCQLNGTRTRGLTDMHGLLSNG